MARAELLRRVHYTQRSGLLADATTSLWMAAGSTFSKSQLDRMQRAAAVSQLGQSAKNATKRGSRGILHLTGPGLHYTHTTAACIYDGIRQALRMRRLQLWTDADWRMVWATRATATCGLARLTRTSMRSLGIHWSGPYCITDGIRTVGLSPSPLTKPIVQKILHDLRVFLRVAVASAEAVRLPYSYDGLQGGWNEQQEIRRSTYALRFLPSGPALLSGAIWTKWLAHQAGYSDSPTCDRCAQESESPGHRLWRCPDNHFFHNWLQRELGDDTNIDLSTLPNTFKRCGIVPHDCSIPHNCVQLVQRYMVSVNHYADQYNANVRSGKPPPPPERSLVSDEEYEIAMKRVRMLAIPPIGKARPVPDSSNRVPRNLSPSQKWQLFCERQRADFRLQPNVLQIYFDGSSTRSTDDDTPDVAGYGVSVLQPSGSIYDVCAPVCLDTTSEQWWGADKLTNNTAELSGAIAALLYAANQCRRAPDGAPVDANSITKIIIHYDSSYAYNVSVGTWRVRSNFRLARRARSAYQALGLITTASIQWIHVDSHSGDYLNDRADALADYGAAGYHLDCICPNNG